MTKEIINEAIKKCFETCGKIDFDYLKFLLYGDDLTYAKELNYSSKKHSEDWKEVKRIGGYSIDNIDHISTFYNIKNNFPGIKHVRSFELAEDALIDDNFIILRDQYNVITFYTTKNYNEELISYLVKVDSCSVRYFNGKRFNWMEIKPVFYNDIKDNYNDDLPVKEIEDFIKGKESGLCLFHGCPGSGKTYFIRSLITSNKDCVVCSAQNFESLIALEIEELKDSVLIIEDCETLIKDRNNNIFSSGISDLLNISDGLMGDALNVKVVCTFNTDLRNIDKALLRKGRTKIKYEFKPLTEDKAKMLRDKLNKHNGTSTLLCDILNEDSCGVNDTQVKQVNKIGF